MNIRRHIAWATFAAAAGLVIALIMLPPVVGVADNGDFARVLGAAGLAQADPAAGYDRLYFHYAAQHFGYGDYSPGGYVSTHILLVAAAGWIGRLFDSGTFDIRVLGTLYTLLFASALMLLAGRAPQMRSRAMTLAAGFGLAALLLFVFGDIGYVAYFHSFFGEPYALVFMLLLVASSLALASSSAPRAGLLALFTIAAVAVATSKIQYAPLGFVFALLAWRMAGLRPVAARWRRHACLAAVIIIAASSLMLVVAPNRLRHINLYQALFYGVLKDSPHVAADLEELGIPRRYAVLAGTNWFERGTAIPQNDPVLRREVLERLSHRDVVLYYLRHPVRWVQKLERAADNAAFIRPGYLGNYDASAGKEAGAVAHRFDVWSRWKMAHMPRSAAFYGVWFAAYAAAVAALWLTRKEDRRARLALETMAVVAAAGLFALIIPLIGDGEADLGKHLFMFNVCFDLTAVSAVCAAAVALAKMTAAAWTAASRQFGV